MNIIDKMKSDLDFKSTEILCFKISNRQVYICIDIVDIDFKTIFQQGIVHDLNDIKIDFCGEGTYSLEVNGSNDRSSTIYLDKTIKEVFEFISKNFIPVCELINKYKSLV